MSSGGGPNGDNDSDSGISVDSYTKALKIDVGGGNAATGATAASLPPPPPPPPHVGTPSAAAAATGRQFNSINIMEQFLPAALAEAGLGVTFKVTSVTTIDTGGSGIRNVQKV